jgi:hypothetical protein
MAQPMIVFDHIRRTVAMVGGDPSRDKRLAEILAAQKSVPSVSSGKLASA